MKPLAILPGPQSNISCVLQLDRLLGRATKAGTQLISSFLLSTFSTCSTAELTIGGFSNTAS